MPIVRVHRLYSDPDVFKYVAISDDFRITPSEVMNCPDIPALDSEIIGDLCRYFVVVSKFVTATPHPLIWEVSLDVAEIELNRPALFREMQNA